MYSLFTFYLKLKERWEGLKKNISINPQGNRVRFIPIVPNNVRRNLLPPNTSKSLLFKPFIPKYMTICPNKDNVNTTQLQDDKENKNMMPVNSVKTPHCSTRRFNINSHKSVSLQISQKRQETQDLNTSTSSIEKFNLNSLENSLPKLPLRTIWTNDNRSKNFGSTLPLEINSFGKPFSPNLNCLPQNVQSTNYVQKSKFQNETSVLPNPMNTTNNSRYSKSYSVSTAAQNQKLYPITENMNTSFFTSDDEKSSTAGQNMNLLELNSLNYINQPFNMSDICKNYHCQSPRI